MKKKRDVLFLCQYFYPEYISSATLPYDTAVALKEAGYTVDALCGYPYEYLDGQEVPLREDVDGIGIHRLKYIRNVHIGKLDRFLSFFSFTLMAFFHLFEIGKYESVVVYSNPPILPFVAGCAKKLFGTKLIFVSYDVYPEVAILTDSLSENGMVSRVMRWINRFVFRQADAVVALSGEMKDFLSTNRPIPQEKVHIIPNWYEDQGEPNRDRSGNRFAGLTAGRFVVSYFGNMGMIHDMDTIREAVYALKDDPNVCFLLAGHGRKMQDFRDMVAQEGVNNLLIYDFLKGQDFLDALQISDCAIVSMIESLVGTSVPSKTYSYMMQGLPLIPIMGECDIVADARRGAGIRVRNGDSAGLVDAIRTMQSSPELVKDMQKKCRELFLASYTKDICTQKYVELFRSLL